MKSKKKYNKIFVLQHGEYTCGLACLSMIVKYYGGNINQEDIRYMSGTSIQGTSLLGLYQTANNLGLVANGYESDISTLKVIKSPVILHVVRENNQQHYIVCFEFDGSRFIIGDPSWGILYMSENELDVIWKSKVLLKVDFTEKFIKSSSEKKEKKQWINNILKEDRPILLVSLILGIIVSILSLTTALFSQKLIDNWIPANNMGKLMLGVTLFFILLFFRSFLDYFKRIFMVKQSKDLNMRLVDSFFSKILYLPKAFFDSTKTGEIISRMNDSRRIQQTVSFIVGSVIIEILILCFSVIFLFIYSWEIAVIAFVCVTLFIVLLLIYNKKIVDGQKNVMISYAATEGIMIDILQGVNDIKLINKQGIFKHVISNFYRLSQDSAYKLGIIGAKYGLLIQLVSLFTVGIIIVLGVTQVLNEQLKIGELMAIITVGGIIVNSFASLSTVNIQLQEARVAFDRFYDFLKIDTEFSPQEEQGLSEIKNKTNNVDANLMVEHLSFRFAGRKKLFENLSLDVKKR